VIIKNCFVVAASYPFPFCWHKGQRYPFFRAWGNITHFQNELKETPINHVRTSSRQYWGKQDFC